MSEMAEWEGILTLCEEAALGTEQTQAFSLPLTGVPTSWPVGPDALDVEPVLDNVAWPNDDYVVLGRKGGTITGFETFLTATWLQWLACGITGNPAGQDVDVNLSKDLEYIDSSPANFVSFSAFLELPENPATASSRMVIGCVVPSFTLSWGGNDYGKIAWDWIYRDCGSPTAVDQSPTSLYTTGDAANTGWDFTTSTWDTEALELLEASITYSNGITYDNLVWTDAQTFDEPLLQVPSITGTMKVGWADAVAATIQTDAALRTPKDVAIKNNVATGEDGYIELNFPARIIGDLDIARENGIWTCTFNFEAMDDGTNTFTIITCAPEATKFAIGA